MSNKSVHPRKAKAIRLGLYEAQKPGAVVASDQQRESTLQTPQKKSKPVAAAKSKAVPKGPGMKEVQARAKELGVKANGSKDAIMARIAEAEATPQNTPAPAGTKPQVPGTTPDGEVPKEAKVDPKVSAVGKPATDDSDTPPNDSKESKDDDKPAKK